MTALDESLFNRLLDKYVRRFGEPPPISVGTLDEVMARMRRDLSRADAAGARRDQPKQAA